MGQPDHVLCEKDFQSCTPYPIQLLIKNDGRINTFLDIQGLSDFTKVFGTPVL